ncbi:MAG TPA: hypothetical protein PLH64_10320 [Anaerolineaceae bacterium]|jgi:hypothetical protein|nr:hypothetical protein [Anaerolineaceae bacterium]
MTLSITDIIPNLQQISTCKRFLQVGRDYETIRDAGRVSAEVAKTLALTEYEKYNTARLEREADQPDEDFEQVVRKLKGKNKGNEGENSNVEM